MIYINNSEVQEGNSHTHEGSSHTQDDNQGHSLGEGHTDSSSSYIHLTVQPTDTGMKTTLAGSISSILKSDNTELKRFDELRFSLKEAKKKKGKLCNMKKMVSSYNTLSAKIGHQILSKKTELDERIKDIEDQHFRKYSRLPSKSSNALYSNTLSKRNQAVVILRKMNISL